MLWRGAGYPSGMENFDIFIYAAISIFLISRLWAVLGRRDEDEPKDTDRPHPFLSRVKKPETDEDDVVVIEGRAKTAEEPSVLTPQGHAPTSLAGTLDQIRLLDTAFDEKKFVEGAKAAFQQIVQNFAAGDLKSVLWLLGPNVRLQFEQAIAARRAAGQKLDNKIERLAATDIVGATLQQSMAKLTVEFVSHQINVLRDASGAALDGQDGQTEEVRDLWVFERDMRSSDPNWFLIETRS